MWQSHEEIEDYSVAYFDCIAAFEVPLNFRGSYVLRRLVSYSSIYKVGMSLAFNESSTIQCFKHSNAIKICDGIISQDCHCTWVHSYFNIPLTEQ